VWRVFNAAILAATSGTAHAANEERVQQKHSEWEFACACIRVLQLGLHEPHAPHSLLLSIRQW